MKLIGAGPQLVHVQQTNSKELIPNTRSCIIVRWPNPVTPKPAKGISSTVLLILIMILAVASIPSATSQQFTTSTSFLTSGRSLFSLE